MSKRQPGLATPSIVLAILLMAVGSVPLAQEKETAEVDPKETFTDWGRVSRKVIEPSNEGIWDGTWLYVSRDAQIAIWVKTEKGAPKVQLQYRSLSSAEGFKTDWDGRAEYSLPTSEGKFSLDLSKRDANLVEGRLNWRLEGEESYRTEEGDFRMYRSGDGRFFVIDFSNYRKTLLGRKGERVFETHPSWTFRKVSKRLVLWDELPL
jgi:hypothetical protein